MTVPGSGPQGQRMDADAALAASGASEDELRAGFREFIAAAARMEESHARLAARAERIDRELAASNARLESALAERESLLSALPVGVLVVDPDGVRRPANATAERLVGTIDDDDAERLLGEHGMREVLCADRPLRVQESGLPDGSRLLVVEDRSQVNELEREVRRLDRLAGLSELALGIAHEIKNPLHGVMGFADLMTNAGDDTAKVQRYAGRIREGLVRVDAIVRALLAFAKPGSSEAEPLPFRDAVVQARSQAGLPAESEHFTLATTDDPSADTLVSSGPVVRVLANLFRNAAEAAAPERVSLTVSVRRTADERALEVVVTDDGPGVPEDLAPRIFEPFVSSKTTGHGLGLPLASRVLAYIGGSLRLANPGESGARFEMSIPVVDTAVLAGEGR